MENLTPPLLNAIREVRWSLKSGKAMKESLQNYLDGTQDEFSSQLRRELTRRSQGVATESFTTPAQRAFWQLIERGMSGQPTLEALGALEDEVEKSAIGEIDAHIAELPFKVLLPLLLFQFPAYLLLLLGPMLRELSRQMGG